MSVHLPIIPERPKTWGDCANVPRPCPWVGCRHNLYLDVDGSGRIRYPFKHLEPHEVPDNTLCSLDYATDGLNVNDVAAITGFHRNHIVPTEIKALRKLKKGKHLVLLPLLQER